MAEKKSTQFYHSWIRNLERLADRDKSVCCDLMLSLLRHGSTGDSLKMDSDNPLVFAAELLFEEYSETIDRDTDKYFQKCEQNASNGAKGGRPKNQTVSEKTERFFGKAKKADIDIDIDKDKDKDIDIDADVRKRTAKKTKFHNFDERYYSAEQMDAIEKKLMGGQ